MTEKERKETIDLLHEEKCSCVIYSGGETLICRERGVKDLFRLLNESPQTLEGAFIADKVVGKGAAAIMVKGQVKALYTDVISVPALRLLEENGLETSYGRLVDNIINRKGDGICPVEIICMACNTVDECIDGIRVFLENMKNR